MPTGRASPVPRERSAAIDLLRVAGMVAVCVSHLWRGEGPVRTLTFSWHVPLFFLLSGYLWSPGRAVAHEALVRCRTLLVPFVAWTVTLGVPVVLLWTVVKQFPGQGILHTLWGGAEERGLFAPYWFLPVLFLVAVLYRTLESLGLGPVAVLGVGVVGLAACHAWGPELAGALPHDALLAVPMVAFLAAGRLVRLHEGAVRGRAAWGALLVVASVALLLSGVVEPVDLKLGDFGTVGGSVLVAVAICTGLLWMTAAVVSGPLPGAVGRWVTEGAQVLLVVLMTHTFVYYPLVYVGVPLGLVLVIAVPASFALGVALHRSRLSPLYVGVPRARVRESSLRSFG